MAGRKKSEWSVKMDELEAKLPMKPDGKTFRRCRVGGKYDKDSVAKVCKEKGYDADPESVFAYLSHKDSKVTKPTKAKKAPRIAKTKKTKAESGGSGNLLAKGTYSGLSSSDMEKIISILGSMKDKAKADEIQKKERELARMQKELDNLKK